ncbi:MAG TPA: ABC transporter ATP-binding protein [Terracidiphilus sp.]
MNAVFRTQSLTKKFGRTVALAGIDVEVPEGAIYALVGANGAGKTTLIKVLMNIFQPTSGLATVLGIDSRHIAGRHFERIGYVSENQEMPEWMTLRQLLDYYRNLYPAWDTALEQQLVRQFDLPLNRKLKHMSRGMKMKAAFASSLPYRPALIVLDEPFSGLDPLVRDELIEVLLDRAPETTIFLSSHDLAEIEAFSSHVGYLENGRLLFSEEMTSLAARFREITITLAEPLAQQFSPPAHWLQCESVDRVLRFVDSGYQEAASREELAAVFPGARDIAIQPMSLRAIFLAVAKAGRTQPTSTSVAAETREVQI